METSLGHPLLLSPDTPTTAVAGGPVIHSKLAPLLRFLLHLFNTAFAALGISLIAWALYTGYKPSTPPPLGIPIVDTTPSSSSSDDNYLYKGSWFLTTAGCYGSFILAISLMGFSAARYSVMGLLSIYVVGHGIGTLVESVCLLIVFTPNKIEQLPRDDPYWKDFMDYVASDKDHAAMVKVVVLGLIGAQIVAAVMASFLYSIVREATDMWIDQRYEIRQRQRVEYESIAARAAGEVGSNRVRRKYGLDRRQIEAVEMEAGLWE